MDPASWGSDADGIVITAAVAAPGAELVVTGELDTHGASFLSEAIEALLKQPVDHVRLDLHDVSFIDSAGLGGVLRARRACSEAGVNLTVGQTSASVARLVELAGVADLLADGSG
jgi:anti-anti-sigma factor